MGLTTSSSGWKPVPRILGGPIMTIAKRLSSTGSTDHGRTFRNSRVKQIGKD